MSTSAVQRWLDSGRLHPLHRGVYALGHAAVPVEGRLVAALIHAGPDAVLSHRTAAWWWGLVNDGPTRTEVSTRARASSLPDVLVHRRRRCEHTHHRRFPITTVPQTLIDFAAVATRREVRHALAEAEFHKLLDAAAVEEVLGRGRAGTGKLRKALERHLPQLALTRSELERRFVAFCEAWELPFPEVNAELEGLTVDALWRNERLVVELDGHDGHRTRAQIERDRRRDLRLRAAGFLVIRYVWAQLERQPALVASDLRAALRRPELSAGSGSR